MKYLLLLFSVAFVHAAFSQEITADPNQPQAVEAEQASAPSAADPNSTAAQALPDEAAAEVQAEVQAKESFCDFFSVVFNPEFVSEDGKVDYAKVRRQKN
ncbi:MAG: hypothetical protein AB7F23_10450, partial [Phycisphaerae bacterium]